MNIPYDKSLNDNSYYFWNVTNPFWNNGKTKRIRLKFKVAKRLNSTVNHTVEWCPDQSRVEGGAAGSQKALVYGSSAKETKKAKGMFG